MKKFIYHFLLISLVSTTIFSGCSDIDELNKPRKGVYSDDLAIDFKLVIDKLPPMIEYILFPNGWEYQLQQNLNGDLYSGYLYPGTAFNGSQHNGQYFMMDGWNAWPITRSFQQVFTNWLSLKQVLSESEIDNTFRAYGNLFVISSAARLADQFGPIPYSEYGQENAKFDTVEELYTQFLEELDFIVETLAISTTDDRAAALTGADNISSFEGDATKWARYANTLRLRLAMRIVKANPTLAQESAEKSVNHFIGLLTEADGDLTVKSALFDNALFTITGWSDINMAADIESIMGGYNDPRLPVYFNPATASIASGEFKGIRTGLDSGDGVASYQQFSQLNIGKDHGLTLMTVAESYFLRAEGALRGWAMNGSAQDLYEMGIKASFERSGIGSKAQAYLANTNFPKDYVDPVKSENSIVAQSQATVKWNDSATNEEKLEKIITQKWIAIFPCGLEAWSEFRRTGYPKLFPVKNNRSNGAIPNGEFIKRLTYPNTFYIDNQEQIDIVLSKDLSDGNSPQSRLWWDVNSPNF